MRRLGLWITALKPGFHYTIILTWDPGQPRPSDEATEREPFPSRQQLGAQTWPEVREVIFQAIAGRNEFGAYAHEAIRRALGHVPVETLEAEVIIPDTRITPAKSPFARYTGKIFGTSYDGGNAFTVDEEGGLKGKSPHPIPGYDYNIIPA